MLDWLKYKIRNFFGFSKAETNGTLILIFLMILAIIIPFFFEIYFKFIDKLNFEKETAKLDFYLKKFNEIEKKEIIKIDINKASPFKIKSICNFNIILCKRIIAYKNLLGGYINKKQYSEIFDITTKQIDILKKNTFISKNFIPKKINIKNCKFKDLLRHPYVSYKQARFILKNKHKIETIMDGLNKSAPFTNNDKKMTTSVSTFSEENINNILKSMSSSIKWNPYIRFYISTK